MLTQVLQIPGFRMEISPAGAELFAADPALAAQLPEIVALESADLRTGPFTRIGRGSNGRVSEFPGRDDLCIKTTSSELTKRSWYLGEAVEPEDLILQQTFMNRLRSHLDDTSARQAGHGVSVPKYYAAMQNESTGINVAIMQRLHGVKDVGGPEMRANLGQNGMNSIHERIYRAVGKSPLRLGLDDVNGSNILITADSHRQEAGNIFLIDLPNKHKKIAKAALWLDARIAHS